MKNQYTSHEARTSIFLKILAGSCKELGLKRSGGKEPSLLPQPYKDVVQAREFKLPTGENERYRLFRIDGGDDTSAIIPPHTHEKIDELFEPVYLEGEAWLLTAEGKVPFEIGKLYQAEPGFVHGIEVEKGGCLIIGALILGFSTKDFKLHSQESVAA